MAFWFKKMLSGFLLPLPFSLLCIALGIFLLILHRAKKCQYTLLLLGFLTLLLFSINPISFALLNPLQLQYAPLVHPPSTVSQVVVLGGGVSGGKNYPPNLTLNSASLSRLVEGVRLLKVLQKNNPAAQLILSGGRVFQSPASAGRMRNTAVMLGINQENIALEDGSQDTHQEALFLKKMVGDHPFILVTSAYHMPRAMALFKNLGMHPIAAPTQFLTYHRHAGLCCIPSAGSMIVSDIAIHEYLGIYWAKLLGYIKK